MFPQFETIRQSLYNSKSNRFPKYPLNLEEINNEGEWSQDDTGARFVISHVKEENTEVGTILIFANDTG